MEMEKAGRKVEIDWDRIRQLKRRSFHGNSLNDSELDYCQMALRLDRKRYSDIERQLKDEYRESLLLR